MRQTKAAVIGKVLRVVFPALVCSATLKIGTIAHNSDLMILGFALVGVTLVSLVQVILEGGQKDD